MVHFIGFVIYIFSLAISIAAEVRTIANPGREWPTGDWIYAALVLLMFLLESPSWVYKPAFTVIMLITIIRWLLEHAEWYTGTVERIDSTLCLLLLLGAFAYATRMVIIESL